LRVPWAIACLLLCVLATTSAVAETKDYTVALDKFSVFSIGGWQVRVAVHDDGPKQIRVIFDYQQPVIFSKRDGFDAVDMKTLIYEHNRSRLYYVNIISDRIGHCVLRIKSD
jgi:hypothetical protein